MRRQENPEQDPTESRPLPQGYALHFYLYLSPTPICCALSLLISKSGERDREKEGRENEREIKKTGTQRGGEERLKSRRQDFGPVLPRKKGGKYLIIETFKPKYHCALIRMIGTWFSWRLNLCKRKKRPYTEFYKDREFALVDQRHQEFEFLHFL